ncbi:tRNA (guanine(46)-N(7))-methyltransferase [Saliniradius amylolyticus]|uniref:tRNA (guanine(46)-N(7))-methyltransferase n=1 Tax=Saliniradius amylolyticus TaxID=2183582 RepID=A0A2S2E006_9ALTE|nr:SAM-dependent methyltransferase [Saliniradius amylolyticus]AWL10872.1 tRNA (guanine(46)-N(7))-methyltransferase [Saliniradius amylolyticus]
MSDGNSRSVQSNQTGLHENLDKVVRKHLQHPSRKPVSEHTQLAFEQAQQWLGDWQGPLILDSCCGVGESTAVIAASHPDAKVIGVDKSALRTGRHSKAYQGDTDNYLVLRADLNDFWRLAHQAGWQLSHHYLLYPNPWPKSMHLKRRWHGSAAFADLLKLGGKLTLRSNWKLYLEEFSRALAIAGYESRLCECDHARPAITPFERKYRGSGQSTWELNCLMDSPVAG